VKVAGIQSHMEASANFLNGKIGEPYISNYINHITEHPNPRSALHAIIPDIHAYTIHREDRGSMIAEHQQRTRHSSNSKL